MKIKNALLICGLYLLSAVSSFAQEFQEIPIPDGFRTVRFQFPLDIKFTASNEPLLMFIDTVFNNYPNDDNASTYSKVSIFKFDGTDWDTLAFGIAPGTSHQLVVAPNGEIYLAFINNSFPYTNESFRVNLLKYDGQTWTSINNLPYSYSTSPAFRYQTQCALAIDTEGKIYLAFDIASSLDSWQSNHLVCHVFNGTNWQNLAGTSQYQSIGQVPRYNARVQLRFNPNGNVFMHHIDGSSYRILKERVDNQWKDYVSGSWPSQPQESIDFYEGKPLIVSSCGSNPNTDADCTLTSIPSISSLPGDTYLNVSLLPNLYLGHNEYGKRCRNASLASEGDKLHILYFNRSVNNFPPQSYYRQTLKYITYQNGQTADSMDVGFSAGSAENLGHLKIVLDNNSIPYICFKDSIDLYRFRLVKYVNTASVSEKDAHAFSIHPNPATTSFTLKGETLNQADKVSIYDMTGKLVFTQELNVINKTAEVDISGANPGMYLVKVGNGTQRLIVN